MYKFILSLYFKHNRISSTKILWSGLSVCHDTNRCSLHITLKIKGRVCGRCKWCLSVHPLFQIFLLFLFKKYFDSDAKIRWLTEAWSTCLLLARWTCFSILGKWPNWRTILFCVFISVLYMFWVTSCSLSGESIVSIKPLVRVTLCRWPFCVQVGKEFLSDLHMVQSPTQSDIYQRLYWYNWFSWWWARGCSKHVENWNKYTEKNCRQVGHLPRIITRCTVNKI